MPDHLATDFAFHPIAEFIGFYLNVIRIGSGGYLSCVII